MPNIAEYSRMVCLTRLYDVRKVIYNEDKKTFVILFKNGKSSKAKLSDEDEYDPYVGFSLAYLYSFFNSKNEARRFIDSLLPEGNKVEHNNNNEPSILQSIRNKALDFVKEQPYENKTISNINRLYISYTKSVKQLCLAKEEFIETLKNNGYIIK